MSTQAGKAIEEAVEAASLYTQAEIDQFKLRLAKAITKWSSRLMSLIVMLFAVILVLMFLGLALSMYLQLYFLPHIAYLLVALSYVLLTAVFMIFRNQLIEPLVLKSTLNELFDES
jgi:hypothetical protein